VTHVDRTQSIATLFLPCREAYYTPLCLPSLDDRYGAGVRSGERACTLGQIETLSFQMPLFYAKLASETLAVWQDCPRGYQKHFLKKSL
jgi:hypothetical protein